jgi:fatty aldehyde decarbonylase
MNTSAVPPCGQDSNVPFHRTPDYLRLLSFVTTNAREGEIMAIQNYSQMVPLLPDTEKKIETVHQAHEECKHIAALETLSRSVGFPINPILVFPQWTAIRKHFADAVKKKDLAGCLIVQDLMVESLAIAMYKVFSSASNGDTETNRTAGKLLQDELEHLDIGVRRITELMEQDADAVHDSLQWAHHRVMPELFQMVHYACEFVCNKINLDCDIVDKGTVYIDLEMLKLAALDHYLKMLDEVNFRPEVVNPLVASMSAYEPAQRMKVGSTGPRPVAAAPPANP